MAEDTVRVALPKLEAQLLETEELLVAKLAATQRVADLRDLESWFKQWRKAFSAIESDARVLRQAAPDELARVLDFCDWSETAVRSLEGRMAQIGRNAQHDRDVIGKSVDNLLENAKKLLLLPFATISASFPKLVRDLCREQGKEAELRITGEHVELDKRILQEMKDPLVHMLRNAVDHGVELPAQRAALGKARRATITLAVSQAEGNRVQIVLSDDGAGIDARQVRAAAVRRGLISEEEAARLDDAAAQALVFRSEVSTGTVVTQLSGRGLGLAIVHENTRRLGGEVRLQSQPGAGTTFNIVVPAIRATFRGILCEAAGRLLLMPVALVERVARVRLDAIRTVEGRETVNMEGRAVALVRLADVLELETTTAEPATDVQLLLVGTGDQAAAFAVDAVLEEQEVLVKPLRKPLVRVRNIAAAAVLGTGKVVPILNVADLLKSARHVVPVASRRAARAQPVAAAARSILVAEDSITSRMLLKTILESAGYKVKTAVDGMEAFSLLRTEAFDLLVSDVEMPRLNGFDLTARVRADKKLAELPVVLVTALATREDRERGIDAGANAYIVKGSFDQDNLLEAVERLL
jgi:two-component system chemotaxis sensor kinase CheA